MKYLHTQLFASLLLAALFTGLVSCGDRNPIDIVDRAMETHLVVVSGKVFDSKGNALEKVQVRASGGGALETTDSTGSFRFASLGTGKTVFYLHRAGFRDTISDTLEIRLESSYTLSSVTLVRRTGVIAGTVIDQNGVPIEGAGIQLENRQGGTFSGFAGTFRLEDVEAGSFRIFGGDSSRSGIADVLLVPEDSAVALNLVLSDSGFLVQGVFADEDGNLLGGSVQAGGGFYETETGLGGTFSLGLFPVGVSAQILVTEKAPGNRALLVGGIHQTENRNVDLGTVQAEAPCEAFGMKVIPALFYTDTSFATVNLSAQITDGEAEVDYYLWDFDMDDRTDTTTTTGFLKVTTESDSQKIQVRAANMQGNMTPFCPVWLQKK